MQMLGGKQVLTCGLEARRQRQQRIRETCWGRGSEAGTEKEKGVEGGKTGSGLLETLPTVLNRRSGNGCQPSEHWTGSLVCVLGGGGVLSSRTTKLKRTRATPPRPGCPICHVRGKKSALQSPFVGHSRRFCGAPWRHQEAGRCGGLADGRLLPTQVSGRRGGRNVRPRQALWSQSPPDSWRVETIGKFAFIVTVLWQSTSLASLCSCPMVSPSEAA